MGPTTSQQLEQMEKVYCVNDDDETITKFLCVGDWWLKIDINGCFCHKVDAGHLLMSGFAINFSEVYFSDKQFCSIKTAIFSTAGARMLDSRANGLFIFILFLVFFRSRFHVCVINIFLPMDRAQFRENLSVISQFFVPTSSTETAKILLEKFDKGYIEGKRRTEKKSIEETTWYAMSTPKCHEDSIERYCCDFNYSIDSKLRLNLDARNLL